MWGVRTFLESEPFWLVPTFTFRFTVLECDNMLALTGSTLGTARTLLENKCGSYIFGLRLNLVIEGMFLARVFKDEFLFRKKVL